MKTPKILFVIWCLLAGILFGCVQKKEMQQPNDFAQKSQYYYELAVKQYQGLIAQGQEKDKYLFGLGKLYYSHGDFELAIAQLKLSGLPEAKKLLAISYYRIGDFTNSLEAFNSLGSFDDEYLLFKGRTLEKLNLFDKALEIYSAIKDKNFKALALERINEIEKGRGPHNIKYLSPATYKILSSAPKAAKYPQAGAFILHCDESVEVTADDKEISTLHYIVKILNVRGKEEFSETGIDYDSTYEKVQLEFARTIKPDGTVVDVGTRHIRDVSKYLNFPLYSNARVYIISFPEIQEGSTIEYKVKIYRNQLINKKDFVINYPLKSSEPIIAANFTLKLPRDKALRIKILNEQYNDSQAILNPVVREEKDFVTFQWAFKDIPQIIPESSMPAQVEINPTILASTFDSWQGLYSWWWELAKDKIAADGAIKEKVKALTRGLGSREEKAKAIYNYCAQEIRYVAVEYGDAGYEPHQAQDVFRNKYGDCKDQAILLITMLKEAGLEAWPVLIPTREAYNLNEDLPAMLFNHCIACVLLDGKIIFLDPTAETCSFGDLPPGDQGRRVLICREDGYEIQETPLYPAGHNQTQQILKIKVNADESIVAQKTVSTYGAYDSMQRFWLLYTPPQLVEEALKAKIQQVSIAATLDNYEIKNLESLNQPLQLNYLFRGKEYFTEAGNLRIMPQLADVDTSVVAKEKRVYPIDFGFLERKVANLEISIPDNFLVKHMPQNITEDCPWMKVDVQYMQKAGRIFFSQIVELKKISIPENEYPQFKVFLERLAKGIKQRIVLEKIK